MLTINNVADIDKMRQYHRTSDMLNLIEYFPEISSIKDLVIVEDIEDFMVNKDYISTLENMRVDSLKSKKVILGIEIAGDKKDFLSTLYELKKKDPLGVLVLFNVCGGTSKRYEKYAGISIAVDVGIGVYIEAVGKGFDGREVSKGVCVHERYFIPWFELRNCNINNFKNYQTFFVNDDEYKKSRVDRIKFLESIGLNSKNFLEYIPEEYQSIPLFIWEGVIRDVLKTLEKKEEILLKSGFKHFAISGHTEGKRFCPWGMYDKSRYVSLIKK